MVLFKKKTLRYEYIKRLRYRQTKMAVVSDQTAKLVRRYRKLLRGIYCPFKQYFMNFVVLKIYIFIYIFVSGEIKLQLEGGVDAGKDEFI